MTSQRHHSKFKQGRKDSNLPELKGLLIYCIALTQWQFTEDNSASGNAPQWNQGQQLLFEIFTIKISDENAHWRNVSIVVCNEWTHQ